MRREVVYKVITDIVKDFSDMLTDGIMENSDIFPYTNACIKFISDLNDRGIELDFDSFDQDIINKVYHELCAYLIQ